MPNTASRIDNHPRSAMRSATVGNLAVMQRSTSHSPAEPPLEQWEHKIDQEWQARLKCLEQWLSKLLIKNEQLRMSLALATMARRRDPDDRTGNSRFRENAIHVDEP